MEATMQDTRNEETTHDERRQAWALRVLRDDAHDAAYFNLRHARSGAHAADRDRAGRCMAASYVRARDLGCTDEQRIEAMREGRDAAAAELAS